MTWGGAVSVRTVISGPADDVGGVGEDGGIRVGRCVFVGGCGG